MGSLELVIVNLTSPAVLCFTLGILAATLKSDLRVPPQVHETISMYLLLSIGLKGGLAISQTALSVMVLPILMTALLGSLCAVLAYQLARRVGRLSEPDAAALAAHYGSVSAVTYMAAISFAATAGLTYEGYFPVLLAVLEMPAIIIALFIARRSRTQEGSKSSEILHEVLTGKTVVLLLGGIFIGMISGPAGARIYEPIFVTPFQGILMFFLLEMGIIAGGYLKNVRKQAPFLLTFGIAVPLAFSLIGFAAGNLAGLSATGCAILATMAASASYIAAPAAVKLSLPEADVGLCLTASVAITLPFNLAIGIPVYFQLHSWIL
jgi:hypothetical protein